MARKPDQEGPAGRAFDLLDNRGAIEPRPDHEGGLAAWLLNVPGAHPFWSWWMLAACHLRPIPGAQSARKHYPGAEYEFAIITINPEEHPIVDPDNLPREGFHLLRPSDVVHQFHGVTDADVKRIAALAVRAIVTGQISPDQDYRSMWEGLIDGTVAHYREGRHQQS